MTKPEPPREPPSQYCAICGIPRHIHDHPTNTIDHYWLAPAPTPEPRPDSDEMRHYTYPEAGTPETPPCSKCEKVKALLKKGDSNPHYLIGKIGDILYGQE